jgi:uncharacterized membrane protein
VRWLELRVAGMEKALHALVDERGVAVPAGAATAGPATVASGAPTEEGEPKARASAAPVHDTSAPPVHDTPIPPSAPAYGGRAPVTNPLWSWLTGGNALARVGVILLFLGVAFLVKYAAQKFTVPIEVRLAAIALGGFGLLGLGLALRVRRPAYAATLQGAGIGVLYLTVYAALALYHVLPAGTAFVLLALVVAVAGVLAVRQDALALAVLGALGGYLAPVLTATQAGSHVLLFGYYAALNAGVFAIAWLRTWRALNVLGFVCTFIVATVWGVTRYQPADFATTEPFLVLSFLFYVGIATAFGVRRSIALRDPVDATLVFGTPIVVAALQSRLVADYEYGMAWSAVGMAAVYGMLALALQAPQQPARQPLVAAYAGLALVFATLAIPLAFDARVTSALWALEGAALCVHGLRAQRPVVRMCGLALQLAAGVAHLWHFEPFGAHTLAAGETPFLNSTFIGGGLIALAGAFTAWRYGRAFETAPGKDRLVPPLALAWALLWWLGSGWHEIDRAMPAHDVEGSVAWLALTAVALVAAAAALRWRLALTAALAYPLLLFALAAPDALDALDAYGHVLHGYGLVWLAAIAVAGLVLRAADRDPVPGSARLGDYAHAFTLWLVTLLALVELAWLAAQAVASAAWRSAVLLGVPAAVLAALARTTPHLPVAPLRWQRAYRVLGGSVLAVVVLVSALALDLSASGDARPLPFVPLLNPLDLAFVAVALALWRWWQAAGMRAAASRPGDPRTTGLAALAGWAWMTMSTLRTVHHWAGVPFDLRAAWHSPLAQAALALAWTVTALLVMVVGNRRRVRDAWLAGAGLLALVVAKLFLVDLAQAGTIERIVSFIGVGALLLAIGYLAPVPSRRAATPDDEAAP